MNEVVQRVQAVEIPYLLRHSVPETAALMEEWPMSTEAREYCLLQRKIAAIQYADVWGNVAKACRTFCVSKAGFYRWKKIYDAEGEDGLKR